MVAGAGGFVGGHLVRTLLADGIDVRAADIRPAAEWYQHFDDAENVVTDLRLPEACARVLSGVSEVYNLAADMGGIGFIENNKALCMLSVLINTQLLRAAVRGDVSRFFFSSSACVYPVSRQLSPASPGLRESDAYPADPEGGYGWEKLFSERMCNQVMLDFGLDVRVARYHNVYGPHGPWMGGREKAPAAICRKIALAKLTGRREIEVWGDGEQTRSFTYADDCICGTRKLMDSDVREPVNLGSAEVVTINELIDMVAATAGISVQRRYNHEAAQGVRGRSSDNTIIRQRLGWEPRIRLRDGLESTYRWVEDQVATSLDVRRRMTLAR